MLMTNPSHEVRHEGLSILRSIGLGATLVSVVALALVVVCAAVGIFGFFLTESGVITFAELTTPGSIIATVLLASIVITIILCIAINRTLVRPLRRMTLAMKHLAKGDFTYRMEETSRIHLREVDEFAESYNVAADELAGTEMMRAGFISDFSHEFRTPISSLSGFAQLLRDEDLSPEERREYADIIVEESERLAGLSERILLLSKMEASAILPNVQKVDLAESLRRAAIVMETKLREKNVSIELALDEAYTYGNSSYLAQLWLNLLDNAVKFSPVGGRVSVALYGGRQGEEDRTSSNDTAVVWISDEGCGMDEATRARIFDRFYQGDSSHAAAGSGLGLALCKRIVELHKGVIEVQSVPNRGSVFEIRLPLIASKKV